VLLGLLYESLDFIGKVLPVHPSLLQFCIGEWSVLELHIDLAVEVDQSVNARSSSFHSEVIVVEPAYQIFALFEVRYLVQYLLECR
jgi:hypothetical protein